MKSILILGNSNIAAALMAEGWMRYYGGREVKVQSAGITASRGDNYTLRAMTDAMIDVSDLELVAIKELDVSTFDFIIAVGDDAERGIEVPAGKVRLILNPFQNPSLNEGTDEEMERIYSRLRDQIEDFVFDFVHFNIKPLFPPDMENLFIEGR